MSKWPSLRYGDWVETRDTLHLFLQMIGKVRLKTHPKLNHWWHVTLYPHVRGLTTGRIPFGMSGFEIFFDMLEHKVVVSSNDGRQVEFSVPGLTVAGFYEALFSSLDELDIHVEILAIPYDNKSTISFPEDHAPRQYDRAAVSDYWRALCSISSVFEVFRSHFTGKQTPVQLYWHSFDLVVTRFSGKPFPLAGGTQSDREAYSHEVISAGFWPGDDSFQEAAFYGYAYPEPEGLNAVELQPASAYWAEKNGGALAILPYEAAIAEPDPAQTVLAFLDSLYAGAAQKANWPSEDLRHQHV
ncbi:DUF5996 family protein [Maricaulis sp.]|uniref:DUF5996 family protein n=1 Tax=Maricaulis sp. TaxID=1486257 RepID=UPI0026176D96|nr:DUF5996 family protein [Maricaulis sp.]